MRDDPHFTYIHWSESDVALYVGMTRTPAQREAIHASNFKNGRGSKWWPVVHRIEYEEHPGYWRARIAEDRKIDELRPTFNRMGGLDTYHRLQAERTAARERLAPLCRRDVVLVGRLRSRDPEYFDALLAAVTGAAA